MKNILVVDDSALMRRVLSDIINEDDELHTDISAGNGFEALQILERGAHFDAIILDIIMPKMNGIEFLRNFNMRGRKEKVLIVSTIATDGAKETIEALELGAFDFVTKPGSLSDIKSDRFAQKLLKRIYLALDLEWDASREESKSKEASSEKEKAAADDASKLKALKRVYAKSSKQAAANRGKCTSQASGGEKKLVALACSTGGPKALQQVIPYLPPDLDAPVLLVQHMPVGFTASLSARLDELSDICVKEAEDGEVIQRGTVYIAKGGSQMRLIEKNRQEHILSVREEAARNGLKPCADIMYESLMNSSFDTIVCVIMTGMGADGTKGIVQLEETNKIHVIAQDEASSTVYGMPKAIADSGMVDEVHDLRQIAAAITKHVGVR
jgi:two-component system chemotaxis response regulator CheB